MVPSRRRLVRPTTDEVSPSTGIGAEFDEVLAAAQAGGEWAFAVLYRALNPRLLRYFASQVPGVAEDLAAETWIGVARNLGGFTGSEDDFRGWVFRIAQRRLVQHWRDLRRRPPLLFDPATGADAAGGDDPEAMVVASETAMAAVRTITEVLTADQAAIVLLRVLGGLSVEQVATVLDKRPGAIRVAQHRALRKLADKHVAIDGVTE